MPTAEVQGDAVTFHNVRNFRHRSEADFDVRWEDRRVDLSTLVGLDMCFAHWGSPRIAHTIMSWRFADGQALAISIETRKSRSQGYSAVAGFFRQYELVYVVADERDVIALRADVRRHEMYLYRLCVSRAAARALLLDYVAAMNELARTPRWYNALAANCTTVIREHVIHAGGSVPFSWRLFANGYLPQYLYERGSLDTSLPFERLKAASRFDERARAASGAQDYSERIRAGLPMRPLAD